MGNSTEDSHESSLIGEILVAKGIVTDEDVSNGLEYQMKTVRAKRLGEYLVEQGKCTPQDILQALSEKHNLPIVDLETVEVSKPALDMVSLDICREHGCFPVRFVHGVLVIAISDPVNIDAVDTIRFAANVPVEAELALPDAIQAAIKKYYEQGSIDQKREDARLKLEIVNTEKMKAEADNTTEDDKAMIKLINLIISQAIQARASDIHIEPMINRVVVRYRIDGVLEEMDHLKRALQGPVISRIKIMANLKLDEKRLPQDGKIIFKLGDKRYDLRVSTLAGHHGESVVLRILDKEAINFGLEHLGMIYDHIKTFRGLMRKSNGLVLITGPTGSGKTTTLYSALSELNRPDKKIITVENPVEYTIPGINQCQVDKWGGDDPAEKGNGKKALSFHSALRAMLRQAPNIILIGEIRDAETAHIAIEASLTGHLVFSTLHTNDAPSAVTRLIDIGIKPFLTASCLQAVLAQRLVRKLCPECKIPETDPRVLGVVGGNAYVAKGCERCRGTGYKGRLGIYELMIVTSALRSAISDGRVISTDGVRALAIKDGMCSLYQDGRNKVLSGLTSYSEVLSEARQ